MSKSTSIYIRGKKMEDREAAIKLARDNLRKRPEFDWYVVECPTEQLWYIYRGSPRPLLQKNHVFIFDNGLLATPAT